MELALLLLPLLALAGLRYVPEDTALTVHRFGRYARTLSPGLRFTVPVLDRIAHRVRLVGHQVEIPVRGESSARAAVYYQILEPQRAGNALDHVDTLVEQHALEALSSLAATEGEIAEGNHGPAILAPAAPFGGIQCPGSRSGFGTSAGTTALGRASLYISQAIVRDSAWRSAPT